MISAERLFLSGNEAVATAALHAKVTVGTGYPGTPSTEILETLSALGGRAQWAPNEKVAAEVGLGVAFARGRALVTMKHVGLNVAADVLFTAAYSGVSGGYVIACADDPGMASSQNEQDTRRYGVAAGVPVLDPLDPQEAYDFALLAFEVSEDWGLPVILRLTTRVCHTHGPVVFGRAAPMPLEPGFERDIPHRVMVPAHARMAHRELRRKLAGVAQWSEERGPHRVAEGSADLGIIASGVAHLHAREAIPGASHLKLGMVYPLPMATARAFASGVKRCLVIEENDPVLGEALRGAGVPVESAPERYRFGELTVDRVRRIVARDDGPEPDPPRGKPPSLCNGCPHRVAFGILKELDCIVAGDIGCYTLAALPPLEAMDTQICMGASIGVGLGMRHALPPAQARRVVSVIGDSTFIHSGVTGLMEMVYNPPPSGHVLLILDNGITAMTGRQEHPGTGRTLDHRGTGRVDFEALARAAGVTHVAVFNPAQEADALRDEVGAALRRDALSVIIVRQPCILAAADIRAWDKANAESACGCDHGGPP